MELGLVGKPNVGKSTFFSAATLAPAEVANYPFTTIEANRGVAYVRVPCPHVALKLPGCHPKNASCRNGVRWVPVGLVDVAGLVPGAHLGRGLGNRFLDDLRQASALIHVVDASGGTDSEGRPVPAASHEPAEDLDFLRDEIERWLAAILGRDLHTAARKVDALHGKAEDLVHERLSGLGITHAHSQRALRETGLTEKRLATWTDDEVLTVARTLLRISRPLIVAANKADLATDAQLGSIGRASPDPVEPTAADAELALRRAREKGLVEYEPGEGTVRITGELQGPQRRAVELIEQRVLKRFGGTGVQACLERGVFGVLERIAVFPVEDETHYTDSKGNVLPDAFLVPKGTTAREFAYRIHTDLGEGFIRAVDARTHRAVAAEHVLAHGDVVRILSRK